MALPFAGKHCVVVGATGVIGSSIAKAFSHQGAVISLLGRSALDARPPSGAAASSIQPTRDRYGHCHSHSSPDGREGKKKKKTIENLAPPDGTTIGPIDILVNCAGISQTTLLKRTPDEELSAIVDTNLLATMLICKHAKMRPNGCIINISSLMATKGGLGATAYAASKAGVIGFTRALCREMASRSIRVNALLPGWVNGSMWTDLKPEIQQAYLKDTPLNRVADPTEVADAALFLASNGFANNCILNLDGGLSAA
ncbi:hypothetical protein TrVGV298_005203 [Trichoderma virens]|nr:hypothetical protein TrVGV298_005203 [Trichoderma virens]